MLHRNNRWAVASSLSAVALIAGCAAPSDGQAPEGLNVVATTPILADVVSHVAGEDANVTALIPAGKDPHTFEPSLRTIRNAANADVAFANGYLLEPQGLMDTLRETTHVPVIEVADQASTRGAKLVPLVENTALDTVWLGLRIQDAPANSHAVELSMVSAEGPGDVAAYVVSTFGTPEVLFNSADGINDHEDTARLPANAHTHVSWGFSKPGIYRIGFKAHSEDGATAVQNITVAVGVNPPEEMRTHDEGHVDITANIAAGSIDLQDNGAHFDPNTTAVALPSSTLQPIPPNPAYRFLGRPGSETYLLPQAVLGKHIHGEVDPHLWHNVDNVIAETEVVADNLALADPTHGAAYRERAASYIKQLKETDAFVAEQIASIPQAQRHLVTPHHGYAYLDQGYGMHVAGFITPNPAIEPSPRDVIALRRTLENLHLPAVFVEPTQQASTATLTEAAAQQGIRVCTIYGDALDEKAPTYIDMMRTNAQTLHRCLNPSP
ncbi:ABC transporter substrate-binding protein [Corynebacterium sp. HMSC036D03]|uniref:anchored repeat ABC transporter, substrate-binding protein n=1 Tax=Corynebacterium TaxID=1716 RepID=UPI0007865505|nr:MULTISPECIES: anchored repeat ABC transporter, substrate-binding protein [Corynebacterium]OFR39107.1 ABC transporter substrate-binding protein [Corynebacterium sp. HMSC077D03]OHO68144.1 ABC transporter substrate-binding protein [Corynebacterium sp. HMSC036D03]